MNAARPASQIVSARRRYRELMLGADYSPTWDLTKTFASAVAIAIALVLLLDAPSVGDLVFVPLAILYGSFAEHFGHRWAMHRRVPGLDRIFLEHKVHHRFFTHTAMHCDASADMRMVMFSPILLGYFVGIFVAPTAAIVWLGFGWNPAVLVALVTIVYYASFELWHLTAHLPASHPVCRAFPRLTGWFRERHRRHHHPDHQTTWNFNVVLPIADHILGATAPKEPTS